MRYLSWKIPDLNVSETKDFIFKICDICVQGRQYKEVETKKRERANELLQIIHS